jgi:hypothetical protein
MVDKSKNIVSISNKWVLTKKCNKEGNVIKYKAQLVAYRFMQHLEPDYNEMFFLVMWFETI